MRTYKLNITDRTFDVEVKTYSAKEATLVVNGKNLTVKVSEVITAGPAAVAPAPSPAPAPVRPAAARVATPSAPATATGNAIKAPIPGAILSVHVAAGDHVAVGQLLVKMEAMKMENQIKSTRAGKIIKVCVAPGSTVPQGQDLVIIE